jgi:RNA polymerase sigma factor (sigma-70 family)
MEEMPEPQEFIAQMRPALVSYFKRRTGIEAESEDLAQDVLMRALTHANWTSPAEARNYIFSMAVNRWRDLCRRRKTHGISVEWDENTEAEAGAENPPERVLMVREELDRLDQALSELNERTRTVLVLVKLEKVRIAVVAETLGISVSAVNKHLARGLAHLAQMRNREDGP